MEPSSAVTIHFAYSVAPGGLGDGTTAIFEDLSLIDSDDLRVFELNSALADPEFPAFLARAVNGQDDDIRVNAIGDHGGGIGHVAPESFFVTRFAGSGPDLAGSTPTGVALLIDNIEINPNASFGEINWTINDKLRFIGTAQALVPLPPGLILFASASLMLAAWARVPRAG